MEKTHKTIRNLLLLALALIVAGWMAQAWLFPTEAKTGYITAKPRVGDLADTVLASGTITASQLVSVGAQVSGQIKALHVKPGDTILQGDLIAEIDPATQQNALRDAEAALTNIRAQLAAKQAEARQAEQVYARQKKMRALDASPQEDFETAQANLAITKAEIEALNAQIDQAEIAVDTARIDLEYTQIKAPMDGTVVSIPVKEGQTVNASQEAPTIIKLAQLDIMTVEAEISEADVIRVHEGQPVSFTILGDSDTRYNAILRAIEPAPKGIDDDDDNTDDDAVYYNGLFDIANPDRRLRIWMTAEVTIKLNEATNALIVPSSTLNGTDADGQYYVQVIGANGQPENRPVTVGLNTNIDAQIIDGLNEDDLIVVGATTGGTVAPDDPAARRQPGAMF
ncbi:efflux RND transporter periplasmic adaptor subunit [Thalassospira sp.]|uniref:efflux RND transporter periplasmic adaptor subunit n=1 Tax=Thalassospira sp. TaxID=1912094 RepID=UPI0027340E01|nr:efflux RND transporter periplasmic adaptor subunit [Thalassospira sp.]MDP2700356.1 efflux RND transporter periplasmic adaptor subunit [Thalassospira sp.]